LTRHARVATQDVKRSSPAGFVQVQSRRVNNGMISSPVIGLILAGGRATRFHGRDKAFVLLAGRPLLAHVIDRIAPQVDRLVISSNASPESFREYNLPVIPDLLGGSLGPLAGIHAGLSAWPQHSVLSVAVDLPLLPVNLVAQLKTRLEPGRCTYAACGGKHALAILWPPGLATRVEAFLKQDRHRIHEWLAANGVPVDFPAQTGDDILFNINSPEDLARAEARLE
jgi:molybdopterin-guanine dinucleotide biosynthesis protein A